MNKFDQELNENAAKAFFVRHGEKLGLLVGAGLLGLFVYLGVNMSPDLENQTPTTLNGLATQAENRIKSGSWDELKDHRQAVEGTVAKLDGNKIPVDSSNYEIASVFGTRMISKPLRTDPIILPPEQPVVDAVRVSIADTTSNQHPLSFLETLNVLAADSSSDGRNPSAGGSAKKEDVDYSAATIAPGISAKSASLDSLDSAAPISTYMVAVRFVIPYKKMLADFRDKFKNSMGYDAENDRFLIRYMQVERRVNGGGDDAWEEITDQLKAQEKLYVVSAPDPFEEKYDSTVLTRPFPPVLQSDYFALANHPLIPLESLPEPIEIKASTTTAAGGSSGRSGGSSSYRSGRSSYSGKTQSGPPAGGSSMSGMSGSRGMSGGGYNAMNSGGSTSQDAKKDVVKDAPEYKLVRFTDQDVKPGFSYEYRARIWIYDPNNPVKMDDYVEKEKKREAASMSAGVDDLDKDKDNANDEIDESVVIQSNVKMDQLSPETQERLKAEVAIPRPKAMLKNCRVSAWSEPTPAVTVKAIEGEAFVSQAEAPRMGRVTVGSKEIQFPSKEGFLTETLAGVWDDKFGIRIPLVVEEAFVGSVLGTQKVTRVLDPIAGEYKKLENNSGIPDDKKRRPDGYLGNSGVVVVDFMGGQELEGVTESRVSDFRIPTEALFLDSAGRLIVKNSRKDARDYTWMTGIVKREDAVETKFDENDPSSGGQYGGSSRGGSSNGSRGGYPGGGSSGGSSGGYPGAGGSGGSGGRGGYPGGGRGGRGNGGRNN